jgi:hypothetical protein
MAWVGRPEWSAKGAAFLLWMGTWALALAQ